MKKEVIYGERTKKILGPVPTPISWAVKSGNLIFLAGITASTGRKIIDKTMKGQYRRIMEKIKAILEDAGASMNDVVKFVNYVTVKTTYEETYPEIAEIRREYYKDGYFPASTLVEVKGLMLPDQLIEVDTYAVI